MIHGELFRLNKDIGHSSADIAVADQHKEYRK
jgi:hypothetical protein